MLKYFRVISTVEGLSYLTILSVAFGLISRDYVYPIGIGHGILFLLYLFLSLLVSHFQGWSLKVWLPLFFASVVPFAFIPVDRFLKRAIESQELAKA